MRRAHRRRRRRSRAVSLQVDLVHARQVRTKSRCRDRRAARPASRLREAAAADGVPEQRMISAPTTAATQVLRSKNSSIGSPRPSALARKPPSERARDAEDRGDDEADPRSPPGMIAFAIMPARSPRTIQAMMLTTVSAIALDDGRVLTTATVTRVPEAAPARPEDEREQEADDPDDHEDHADRGDVHARHLGGHRPRENGADGDEQDAEADAHVTPFAGCRFSFVHRRRGDTRPPVAQKPAQPRSTHSGDAASQLRAISQICRDLGDAHDRERARDRRVRLEHQPEAIPARGVARYGTARGARRCR